MPAPRLSPLLRLLICLVGIVIVQIVVYGVIDFAIHTAAILKKIDYKLLRTEFWRQNLLLVNLLFYPPTLLWLWACRRLLDRRSFASLGLRPWRMEADFGYGLLAGAAAVSFLFGLLFATKNVFIAGLSAEAFLNPLWKTVVFLSAWFFAFVIVGFMEEISFRGYALHNLAARLSLAWAIGVQAVVFAFIHIGNLASPLSDAAESSQLHTAQEFLSDPRIHTALVDFARAVPNLLLIAVFFAVSYLRTGSLWFPIGFHSAWNFFLGCIYSLPVSGLDISKLLSVQVSGNSMLTGGSFGAEGSILLTPIILAMIYVMARFQPHPQAVLDLGLLRRKAPTSAPVEPAIERREFKTRFGSGAEPNEADIDLFKDFTPAAAGNMSPFHPIAMAEQQAVATAKPEPSAAPTDSEPAPVYTPIELPAIVATAPAATTTAEATEPATPPAPPQPEPATTAPPTAQALEPETAPKPPPPPRRPAPKW